MSGPDPISIDASVAALGFLGYRTPSSPAEDFAGAFAQIAEYRDGGVFIGHWAGRSEWERHPVGDEIVMVVSGETTISFLTVDGEARSTMGAGQMVVVPQGTWHRFDTPDEVEVLTVTPQPTDHSVETPRLSPS